ncbi:hypothetical protein FDX19_15470 [Citrobacter sp. wls619]|uniref:excisionase n=1 Tax=Citrobacter sp. wls619 TaxID=2576432 RepID=UPI0010C9D7B9|nr:excisionase [Citrobacter sp. wls619]TKV08235.1 hypothetical protein FDX19_15470 [Citrobacter sp. wls619]
MTEWAKAHFKEPPCAATLRVIAKTRQTYPPAIKQGRRWLIDETAQFVGLIAPIKVSSGIDKNARALVERVLNGSSTT